MPIGDRIYEEWARLLTETESYIHTKIEGIVKKYKITNNENKQTDNKINENIKLENANGNAKIENTKLENENIKKRKLSNLKTIRKRPLRRKNTGNAGKPNNFKKDNQIKEINENQNNILEAKENIYKSPNIKNNGNKNPPNTIYKNIQNQKENILHEKKINLEVNVNDKKTEDIELNLAFVNFKSQFENKKIDSLDVKRLEIIKKDDNKLVQTSNEIILDEVLSNEGRSDITNYNETKFNITKSFDTKIESSEINQNISSSSVTSIPSTADLYRTAIKNKLRNSPFKDKTKFNANHYKPLLRVPEIESDDELSLELSFAVPYWAKNPKLSDIVGQQNHDELSAYFKNTNNLNLTSMFPDIKNVTNDSPNRWRD